jgi:hypothetical protein
MNTASACFPLALASFVPREPRKIPFVIKRLFGIANIVQYRAAFSAGLGGWFCPARLAPPYGN